jgi:hypothetical protein
VANLGKQYPGWRIVRQSDATKSITPSSIVKSVSFVHDGIGPPASHFCDTIAASCEGGEKCE